MGDTHLQDSILTSSRPSTPGLQATTSLPNPAATSVFMTRELGRKGFTLLNGYISNGQVGTYLITDLVPGLKY